MTPCILEIALPTPLRHYFDYLPPVDCSVDSLQPGIRLQVPFGPRTLTGILLRLKQTSDIAPAQLKHALSIIDETPVLGAELMILTLWAARYYYFSPGEAVFHALPPSLRKGRASTPPKELTWNLAAAALGLGNQAFKGAPRQQQAWQYLLQHQQVANSELTALGLSRSALQSLEKKGLATAGERSPGTAIPGLSGPVHNALPGSENTLQLNHEQHNAVAMIVSGLGRFQPYLLDGVTGSGKTEVYLQAIGRVLARQEQALVLVPEIGLTPQTITRFQRRFGAQVVAMHSGLSDSDRLSAWRAAQSGHAGIVIGTRSAVFTPFRSLGLIVVDEEHDTSYKQHEGFRYSARDVAVKRAQLAAIPIVMGSATPAIESLHNTLDGRYQLLQLRERAGGAKPPHFTLVDLRSQTLEEGFCRQTLDALHRTITQGNQALIFINRRGFAPTLMCHACGWVAECSHCDARLVIHKHPQRLQCHHCDSQQALPPHCPQCHQRQLQALGHGTERSETFLKERFPTTSVLRIDRDTTRGKGSLDTMITRIRSGEPALLIGTQMLAKGHHFPDVTLVVVIDADTGLCSADFRGTERTAQMLTQVAGRAGRADKPGTVLIQTHTPDHPLLALLIQGQYRQLSSQMLSERHSLSLPPYGYLAVVRCSGTKAEPIAQLLQQLRERLDTPNGPVLIGPLEPPIAKLAGRYRCQLLLKHVSRGPLHQTLHQAVAWLQANPEAKRLRWSIDVDPQDFI
jgi:primosomal protein N' (replication factor Y)